jgi:hypothetical protein
MEIFLDRLKPFLIGFFVFGLFFWIFFLGAYPKGEKIKGTFDIWFNLIKAFIGILIFGIVAAVFFHFIINISGCSKY